MKPGRRLLCYGYLAGAVALRDVLMHGLHGRFPLVRSSLFGVYDFVRGRQGYKDFGH